MDRPWCGQRVGLQEDRPRRLIQVKLAGGLLPAASFDLLIIFSCCGLLR